MVNKTNLKSPLGKRFIEIIMFLSVCSSVLFAKSTSSDAIAWGGVLMTLLGGLAFFLYGMNKMSEGMKKAAGEQMRNILSALTNNRIIGMTIGAFVTMIIQSSSATTVMLVSFVQAQLMTFTQSLGVILGADIGTTITAQLIAFKLTDYALLMIAGGFAMTLLSKKDSTKYLGEAILGFGILFFGIKLMSDAMRPLRTFLPFIELLKGLENPIWGLFIGAIFTALIQSSGAFAGIIIVLAQQGLLTLDAGIPLIFGANLGTCVTAGLASIGTAREAKRVALGHVLFKIGGILLFFLWIPTFADLIRWISPVAAGTGIEKLAAETPRQIANAHTVFNVSLAFIFLPFTTMFSKLIIRILPDKEEEKGIKPATWHLDYSAISTPALALNLARNEMFRMYKILNRMMRAIIHPFLSDEPRKDQVYEQLSLVEGISMRENKIDYLEKKVSDYLIQISRQELSNQQAQEVFGMISIVKDMESIGDTIHRNLIPLIDKKQQLKEDFSDAGKLEIKSFHTKVMKQMARLRSAFKEMDLEKAKKVMSKDLKYRHLESVYRLAHIVRVKQDLTQSVATDRVHTELMDILKQINVYLANIAKTITDID